MAEIGRRRLRPGAKGTRPAHLEAFREFIIHPQPEGPPHLMEFGLEVRRLGAFLFIEDMELKYYDTQTHVLADLHDRSEVLVRVEFYGDTFTVFIDGELVGTHLIFLQDPNPPLLYRPHVVLWVQVFPMPPEERAYYLRVHGFDPLAGFISQDDPLVSYAPFKLPSYFYEAYFPLANDPQLIAAEVHIGARVIADDEGVSHNFIIFRRGSQEAYVHCTHTVVYAGPAGDALTYASDELVENDALSPEARRLIQSAGGPIDLPPWGHFAALKSYVAGIAELGISRMLSSAHAFGPHGRGAGEELPFGFNAAMQVQVMGALRIVAPQALEALRRDWVMEMVEAAPSRWLAARHAMFAETFPLPQIWEDLQKYAPADWLETYHDKLLALFSPPRTQDSFKVAEWDGDDFDERDD